MVGAALHLAQGVDGTIKTQWSLQEREVPWQRGWEWQAEARAATSEILNKIGDPAGELGTEDSRILMEVVQNIEYSETWEFFAIGSTPFLLK